MKKKMWIILAAAVVVLAVVIWLLCLNSGLKQDKNDLTAQLADAAKTASQLQTDLDAAKADIDALTSPARKLPLRTPRCKASWTPPRPISTR